MPKIQGEGDYDSARRYDERTRKFVEETPDATTRDAGGEVDQEALRKARSKAKAGGQDQKDARVFRKAVSEEGDDAGQEK